MPTRRRLRGALAPWLLVLGSLLAGGCGGGRSDAPVAPAPVAPPSDDAILAALASALPALPDAPRVPAPGGEPSAPNGHGPCPTWSDDDPALARDEANGALVVVELPPFRIRLPAAEAVALTPYVTALIESASATLSARYGATAPATRIDMYADAAAFRARIRAAGAGEADLDGAHCRGIVVMLSPAGGAGNWGQTLHHELAHVFQAALADGRMPRWLAEGLAESDTRAARSAWRRELDGTLTPLVASPLFARVERGLLAPRSSVELGRAYFIAAELVTFLRARAGDAAMRTLLARLATGDEMAPALLAATGESATTLEAAFLASLEPRLLRERTTALPELVFDDEAPNVPATARRAADALIARRIAEARALADEVLLEQPANATARYVRARAALLERDVAAERDLERLIETGHDIYEVRIALARSALVRGRIDVAARHAAAALATAPERTPALDLCLRLAESGAPGMDRATCARRLADLDERAAELNFSVMSDADARRDWPTVRVYGENLVYMVPARVEVHDALARAYDALGLQALASRERAVSRAIAAQTPPRGPRR